MIFSVKNEEMLINLLKIKNLRVKEINYSIVQSCPLSGLILRKIYKKTTAPSIAAGIFTGG